MTGQPFLAGACEDCTIAPAGSSLGPEYWMWLVRAIGETDRAHGTFTVDAELARLFRAQFRPRSYDPEDTGNIGGRP